MAAYQPTLTYLTPCDQTVGAGLLAKAAWQAAQLDRVHIHCCGNGHLGFRPNVNCPPKVGQGTLLI